jgi:hypothetical protein
MSGTSKSTKICNHCKQEKSITEFGRNDRSKDKLKYHCKACDAKRVRERYKPTPQSLEKRRNRMRDYRADPIKREQMNAARRNNPKYTNWQRQYIKDLKEKHFFIYRARFWSAMHDGRVSALELFHLWRIQKGKCALSGRKLDRSAHLDHIHPVSKGGIDHISNLRWLDPLINIARRNMTDEEYVKMCRQVADWNE